MRFLPVLALALAIAIPTSAATAAPGSCPVVRDVYHYPLRYTAGDQGGVTVEWREVHVTVQRCRHMRVKTRDLGPWQPVEVDSAP